MSCDRDDGGRVAGTRVRDGDRHDAAILDLGFGRGALAAGPAYVSDLDRDGARVATAMVHDDDAADRTSGQRAVGVVGHGAEVVGCRIRIQDGLAEGLALARGCRAQGRGAQGGGLSLGVRHMAVTMGRRGRLGGGRLGCVRGHCSDGECENE